MELTVRRCLLRMTLVVIVAGGSLPAVVGEEARSEKGGATLVIVASGPGGGLETNEFITLQLAGSQIKWTATLQNKDEPVQGNVEVRGLQLTQVFERVNRLTKKTKLDRNSSPHYSLLLINANGAKTCVRLDQEQRLELGKEDALGPIFANIVERFVYARANMMLPIVIPDYVPTQVTVPATKDTRELRPEFPKTKGR